MPQAPASLWWDTLPESLKGPRRSALPGYTQVDVAIVGAGYTGLWTAYYLARADPGLRVLVVEKETAGFGASGRNGGWCSALFPATIASVAKRYGRAGALALAAALRETVDEVGKVAALEDIDCHFHKGGTVVAARSAVQLARARAEVAQAQAWGLDLELLDAAQTRARVGASSVLGGTWTPHCAAIHPARLVRGLAFAAERHGVRVHEGTAARAIESHVVRTSHGDVSADIVIRATEGFTATLPGLRRRLAPVYSLMLATEPLSRSMWEAIGLGDRETFNDYRHLIIYGQRTADGRLAFGGRGAPYHFGSRVEPSFDRDPTVHTDLVAVLREIFPALGDLPVSHRWGGPLGVPRDWFASVGLDRRTGVGWAGGYVGDGVGTSNLAGRTLADLVLRLDTELTRLPWVGHHSPSWEPEPLRWLGINAGLWAMTAADATESRTERPSRVASLMNRFLGS